MKIYARSIGSQLGSMAIDNVVEVDKLAVLKSRYAATKEFETRVKKLNLALMGIAIMDKSEKPKQLKRLEQAKVYADLLKKGAPQGFGPALDILVNEITSLREGLTASNLRPKDMVVSSCGALLVQTAKLNQDLSTRIQAQDVPESVIDPAEQLIIKNQKVKEKMPTLQGKPFAVARAPMAFSVEYARNVSSIGYLNSDKLNSLGFKADLLDGYAVIHNQLAIGINRSELADIPRVAEKPARAAKTVKTVKKVKHRAPTIMDVAENLKRQIEKQTKTKWAFVSDKSIAFNGGSWYWLMPAKDVNRLASVFPGGHLKLQSWGFAF